MTKHSLDNAVLSHLRYDIAGDHVSPDGSNAQKDMAHYAEDADIAALPDALK